ncbi:MAG TPA: hypothetical protein VHQ93_18405 [Chitinophagaceae bacterium]|jgi:predicted PurR-regulated permease PerM|nr:hypothetical protein [Chitinophagaceae bacterium]
MQKIIVAIFVLIAASFLISFLFNDFHVDLKKVGEEFIRMLGIVLVVVLLLKVVSKKRTD